jgi:hypothetical protein
LLSCRYLTISLAENPNVLAEESLITLAAASAILISAKLHGEKTKLNMSNFPSFSSAELRAFEILLLNKIGGHMNMLLVPSSFVRHLLGVFPEIEHLHSEICEITHLYIATFQEHAAYLLFAPSTVAISALLIAFSICEVESEVWLKTRIPDSCLPSKQNPYDCDSMLDMLKCLTYFEEVDEIKMLNVQFTEYRRNVKLQEQQQQQRQRQEEEEEERERVEHLMRVRSPSCMASPVGAQHVFCGNSNSGGTNLVSSTSTDTSSGSSASISISCGSGSGFRSADQSHSSSSSSSSSSVLDLEAIETDATG